MYELLSDGCRLPWHQQQEKMLLARMNIIDYVMESWRALISILFTIDVGTRYGLYNDAQSSRLLLLPWYGKEEEETK